MATIDPLDEKLAQLMGQDGRQSSEMLAKKLKVSAATVRRRLRKLIKNKLLYIVGVVDPSQFGYPVSVLLAVKAVPYNVESMMKTFAKMPEIKFVSSTTGRYDLIAVGRFSSPASLSAFLMDDLSHVEGLKDIETFVCLSVAKGGYVTLPRLKD